MVQFDKDIEKDPLDELDFVKTPNDEREGPIFETVTEGIDSRTREHEFVSMAAEHDKPGSYHYADAKRGHWSQSSGCTTRGYLNYVFKQDDDLDKPEPDQSSKRVFTHGDLIHLWIQGIFLDQLGEEFVTIEEQIDEQLEGEYGTAGHVDIVIRDHPKFPDPFVIDVKTKSEFKYYSYDDGGHVRTVPSDKHLTQLMGYMHHVGADLGALLYYSKRNDHLEEYWCSMDDETFETGKQNIINVLDHVNQGKVPEPDAEPYMCNPEYCVYKREGICPGVAESDHYDPSDDQLDQMGYEDPDWA